MRIKVTSDWLWQNQNPKVKFMHFIFNTKKKLYLKTAFSFIMTKNSKTKCLLQRRKKNIVICQIWYQVKEKILRIKLFRIFFFFKLGQSFRFYPNQSQIYFQRFVF